MTKKDYIKIANALKLSMPKSILIIGNNDKANAQHQQWWSTTNAIIDELKKDNNKFDENKFFDFLGIFINKTN